MLCCQVEVIGRNVYDLVHPRDHRELRDVTDVRCQASLSRSAAARNRRLFIRMRCQMMTKGHLLASQSSAYRVRVQFVSRCLVDLAGEKWKVKYGSSWNFIALLWEITCHMWSHTVTCHPAVVTPALPHPKLVLDLATPEGCKAKLTSVVVTIPKTVYPSPVLEINNQAVSWPGAEPSTLESWVQRPNHSTTEPPKSRRYCGLLQCHLGLTYILNFWHSGTLALIPEDQSARMSEI